ncbi:MAG: hypothetical protein ACSHWY_03905 [Octadecabacter sp.]
MQLGYIGMPYEHRTASTGLRTQKYLSLANSLNFKFAYFPKLDPEKLKLERNVISSTIKIAFDAAALGTASQNDIETTVHRINDLLDGRLHLGIKMCGPDASPNRKAQARTFETLFSYDARADQVFSPSPFPLNMPCPSIIGLPVTARGDEAKVAAARGYCPMTPGWLPDKEIARIWPAIVSGATSAARRARQSEWHVNRVVLVHNNARALDVYIYGTNSPIRRHFAELAKRGLIGPDIDAHLRRVVIAGSAQKVADDILALREVAGDFGNLNIIDPPGSDPEMIKNTMVRLAEDVLPMMTTKAVSQTKDLEKT